MDQRGRVQTSHSQKRGQKGLKIYRWHTRQDRMGNQEKIWFG